MHILIITIHVIAAVLLILIILLQQSSSGGLSGLFGGGGGGTDDILSTPSGSDFLKKATVTLVAIFFLTSLILAVRTSRVNTRSLLEGRTYGQQPVSSGKQTAPLPIQDEHQ